MPRAVTVGRRTASPPTVAGTRGIHRGFEGEIERLPELRQANLAILDFDPFSAEVLADPLPYDTLARESGPVGFLSRHNIWVLARHQHVQAAFADWQTFSSA